MSTISTTKMTAEQFLLLGEDPPDLAVEVLSPGSVNIDRKDKFAQYRKAGVRFYWIVDPQLKTIEGWELKNRR
jgi:Uma2 family endonuclease